MQLTTFKWKRCKLEICMYIHYLLCKYLTRFPLLLTYFVFSGKILFIRKCNFEPLFQISFASRSPVVDPIVSCKPLWQRASSRRCCSGGRSPTSDDHPSYCHHILYKYWERVNHPSIHKTTHQPYTPPNRKSSPWKYQSLIFQNTTS